MAAYLIVNIEVKDAETFAKYRSAVPATIAAHGGKYLVRGGELEVVEGDWIPARVVVLEFPSMEALKRWYDSPEYRPLLAMRTRATVSRAVMVEGV